MMLIKQGHSSVVCRLDLSAFKQELKVLSGSTDNINFVEELISHYGTDPTVWLRSSIKTSEVNHVFMDEKDSFSNSYFCIIINLLISLCVQIATIDLGAIAKIVQRIVEMKKSYDMLKAQFEQAVEMTKKLEGISGVGDFIRSDIFKEIFPEVSEVIEAIDDFSYEICLVVRKILFEDRGYDNACPPKGYPTFVQCRKDYALLATAQYMFQEAAINAQNRGQALDKLMDKISESKTMKEIADLQARIQGELGMIQLAQL